MTAAPRLQSTGSLVVVLYALGITLGLLIWPGGPLTQAGSVLAGEYACTARCGKWGVISMGLTLGAFSLLALIVAAEVD